MNPTEKDLDEVVETATKGQKLSSPEHADVATALTDTESELSDLFGTLTEKQYKQGAGYIKSALNLIRKARGSLHFAFLKEKRAENESPYYGRPTGDDDGAES